MSISLTSKPSPVRHGLIKFARRGVRVCLSERGAEAVHKLIRMAHKPPRLTETDWYWKMHDPGGDRTVYIVGLFGSGRSYLNEIMAEHLGRRVKYLRGNRIRPHSVATSMIYSGHVTMRHFSRGQESPAVMECILEAVAEGVADLIFIYRHPLDSLLTNWVCWRTHIRENRAVESISRVYPDTEAFCVDLERNFGEFLAFAEGNPTFFAELLGPPFLSFEQFLEETELHARVATLTVRLEDFAVNPAKEFSRIASLLSIEPNANGVCIVPPRTKMHRHLTVKERVPGFRRFVEQLSPEITATVQRLGYSL